MTLPVAQIDVIDTSGKTVVVNVDPGISVVEVIIPGPQGAGGGGGGSPTGAAGGSLTGTYPNPTLSGATVATFDAAGVAAAGDSAHVAAGDPHTGVYRLTTDVPKIIVSGSPPVDTSALWATALAGDPVGGVSLHPTPKTNYLISWSGDPKTAQSSSKPTTTEVYLMRAIAEVSDTVNYIYMHLPDTTSLALTAGQNFVGIYDKTGTRLGVSADCTSLWTAAGGGGSRVVKIPLLAGVTLQEGQVHYLSFLMNGSVNASVAGWGAGWWDLSNIGGGIANWASAAGPYGTLAPDRFQGMSWSVGVTSLPSTLDLDYANPDRTFFMGAGKV